MCVYKKIQKSFFLHFFAFLIHFTNTQFLGSYFKSNLFLRLKKRNFKAGFNCKLASLKDAVFPCSYREMYVK